MKKIRNYLLLAAIAGCAIWILLVLSKHARVVDAYAVAQVGDSRKTIRAWVGTPSFSEVPKEKETKYPHAVSSDSYSYLLVRYIFYYDSSEKLIDKIVLSSE